jgi:hypothetical protein
MFQRGKTWRNHPIKILYPLWKHFRGPKKGISDSKSYTRLCCAVSLLSVNLSCSVYTELFLFCLPSISMFLGILLFFSLFSCLNHISESRHILVKTPHIVPRFVVLCLNIRRAGKRMHDPNKLLPGSCCLPIYRLFKIISVSLQEN